MGGISLADSVRAGDKKSHDKKRQPARPTRCRNPALPDETVANLSYISALVVSPSDPRKALGSSVNNSPRELRGFILGEHAA